MTFTKDVILNTFKQHNYEPFRVYGFLDITVKDNGIISTHKYIRHTQDTYNLFGIPIPKYFPLSDVNKMVNDNYNKFLIRSRLANLLDNPKMEIISMDKKNYGYKVLTKYKFYVRVIVNGEFKKVNKSIDVHFKVTLATLTTDGKIVYI